MAAQSNIRHANKWICSAPILETLKFKLTLYVSLNYVVMVFPTFLEVAESLVDILSLSYALIGCLLRDAADQTSGGAGDCSAHSCH